MKERTAGPGDRTAAHWHRWGQHLAIAAAYAACCELTRYVSLSQWLLTAGLRLACLLLLPIRYWPALALGEGVPLIENAIVCDPQFGLSWALSALVPVVVLWMALMKPLRLRFPLYRPDGRVRMDVILLATPGCSIITAISTTLTLMTAMPMAAPGKWSATPIHHYTWAFLLGAYLGALTLTPAILALQERMRALRDQPFRLRRVLQSVLFQDAVYWMTPVLFGLAWLTLTVHADDLRQFLRLALLWPVAVLAWRHGWHGTSIGGMGASIALASTALGLLDPDTLRIQIIQALALSGALLVGTRVALARADVQSGPPATKGTWDVRGL